MAQKLEAFYGFRIEVARAITHAEFAPLQNELAAAIASLEETTKRKFSVYVSMCQFLLKRDNLFGVGPLTKRLQDLTLRWTVNLWEQRRGTLYFLNHQLRESSVLIDKPAKHSFQKHAIGCVLDGSYVDNRDTFRILIATAIEATVQVDRRKVTLSATASPTAFFAARFRNTSGRATTKLDYRLDRSVQLLLEF